MFRKRKVVGYFLLPGVLPRVWGLFSSGFSQLSLMMAVIYRNIGLLPEGHPYLKSINYGKYGIRHVIAEASSNVVYDRQNIDKILVHFLIMAGVVMLLIQVLLLTLSLFSLPVFASVWTNTFLSTPSGPDQDLAFIVLDRVFGVMDFNGVGGFFESCYSTAVACLDSRNNVIPTPAGFPDPFHRALHQFFGFYTLGIAFLSMVVVIYYVIAIVGESITSGRPFGKRLNKAWFLPRLIMFFALIAPMNMGPGGNNVGLNAAQFITLGIAKFGSNMATNAWDRIFLPTAIASALEDTILGRADTLIAAPNAPEVSTLTQFFFVAQMCMFAEQIVNRRTDYRNLNIFLVRDDNPDVTDASVGYALPTVPGSNGNALYYFEPGPLPYYDEAVRFSRYGKIIIRFGHFNPPGGTAGDPNDPPDAYYDELGYVKPVCGEMVLDPTAPTPYGGGALLDRGDPVATGFGSVYGDFLIDPHGFDPGGGAPKPVAINGITELYFEMIEQYFYFDPYFGELAHCMLKSILPYDHDSACVDVDFSNWVGPFPITRWSSLDLVRRDVNYYNNTIKAMITGLWWQPTEPPFQVTSAGGPLPPGWTGTPGWMGFRNVRADAFNYIDQLRLKYDFALPPEVRRLGWAGAALWYHEIANINGMFMSAVQNLPRPTRYPEVMELVAQQHAADESNPSFAERFNPLLKNGRLATLPNPGDQYVAAALYSGYKMWGRNAVQNSVQTKGTGNALIDVINSIFGTDGLYDLLEGMQQGPSGDAYGRTLNVHPLALLSALGKGILDASMRNLMFGAAGILFGEFLDDQGLGPMAKVFGDTAARVALIGVSIGFILYYVLPILPFIYFFFGFGGWVKSIFEAMVAMPLWALAHIKIDGEGLPGPWATNGYFLLFEIFLRPTLLIFGLLASLQVFTSLVNGLNDTFHVVVMNAAGYDIEQNLAVPVASLPISNPSGLWGSIDFLRGPLDEFMYTIIYAILVYMLALSSFKMIDMVPNSILRWMGATVSTFKDNSGDPAGELAGKMYRTGEITRAQLMQMIGSMKGIGNMGGDDVTDTALKTGAFGRK